MSTPTHHHSREAAALRESLDTIARQLSGIALAAIHAGDEATARKCFSAQALLEGRDGQN